MKQAQAILQSARIAELKAATMLVRPRPQIRFVPKQRNGQALALLALLAAERKRNAKLIEQING